MTRFASLLLLAAAVAGEPIRGIYGGVPNELVKDGKTLKDAGVNAVWIGERGINEKRIKLLRSQGAKVFAEFNTLHRAEYLKKHPDAAPRGPDGKPAPAPHGWQGICPTHPEYRKWRMEAFAKLLEFDLDGVWLDYHHAHAAWERADPVLPDTCHCARCKKLSKGKEWVSWRCGVFTDWVREFKEIRDRVRPKALLGTFHCPWSDVDKLKGKLAIDLRAQAKYIDVFSPMPYHARFGHADDPAWISRQVAWLGEHLGKDARIWPIVQLSDWGEKVPVEQVETVIEHGARAPASGVMVFAWGRLRKQPEKVAAMVRAFLK
ncbi:MAG: hypothetical protein ACYTHK_13680 [Planctomycetota bacterium]